MQNHPGSGVSSVRQAIGNYLKMAPYRQGGAGRGASLMSGPAQQSASTADDDVDNDDEDDDGEENATDDEDGTDDD